MSLDWRISRKIGTLTLLMLIILGTTSSCGIRGMNTLHDSFQDVTQGSTMMMMNLSNVMDSLHRVRVRVASAAIETDPAKIPNLKKEYTAQMADLDKAWGEFLKTDRTKEEKDLSAEFEKGMTSYRAFLTQLWERIEKGDGANAALTLLNQEGTQRFREPGTPLRKLLDYQAEEAKSGLREGEENFARDSTVSLILVLVGVILGTGMAVVISRSVSSPIHQVIGVMDRLARDDLDVEIVGINRHDEVGEIARSVAVFKQNAIDKKRVETESARIKQQTEAQHRDEMNMLAGHLESDVATVMEHTLGATSEMEQMARTLSSLSSDVSSQAATVASASEQAAANVETVASATEELSSSVAEIGRQVGDSARIARDAVTEADAANSIVQGLSDSATRIGEIIEMINGIASQTNLLALNATIEAARAGEAGKGFAVVAGEVKNLANQTGKATEDISQQILAIQAETTRAVTAIQNVGTTIRRIDQISAAIASAVEQQNAATAEIARSIEQAAHATQSVSHNIGGVTIAVQETGRMSATVLSSAQKLSSDSKTLRTNIHGFVEKVRQG